MAIGTLNAQAQITVDGVLNANEIGTATTGRYVLVGKYTNPRGFGDWGLLSVYAANTADKLYFFIAGTVQNEIRSATDSDINALQLYIDRPGVDGASASPTALPKPAASIGTSFSGMEAKMDLAPDLAVAIKGNGTANQFQVDAISYTSATVAFDRVLTTTAGPLANTGTALTLAATGTAAPFAALANARMAYRNSTDGKVTSNPGYRATATDAGYGEAGSYGWEIEFDRREMGLTTNGPVVNIFVLQNNRGGDYLSSDFIPQTTTPLTTNSGNPANANTVDFATIAGTQSAAITLATVAASTRAANEAAIAMGVYPNPANGTATVAYNVGNRSEKVNIVLTDLVGRQVQVLSSGLESAGVKSKTVTTAEVAAGTYLVRVQVGDKVATRKVVLL
ncbi:T9SS type A sorting domain-containing protein [Hymenobacter arizonensis]|nr:T9SS type A sorting domain-containing protein [Hymenobacter arizonensis]